MIVVLAAKKQWTKIDLDVKSVEKQELSMKIGVLLYEYEIGAHHPTIEV